MSKHVNKLWREAATLIIVARNPALRSKFDYRVLLLERSSKSRFMPNREVYPGGTIDKCDFSDEWMDLYKQAFHKYGIDFTKLLNIKGPRPPIFRKSHTTVPREIAFRICAIRETFEESGILLLKKMNASNNNGVIVPNGCGELFEDLSEDEVMEWRTLVYKDGSQFIKMCRELECVPDVWSLSEWSDWLTPVDIKIRFDTVFFTCFLFHEPRAQHDNKELIHSQWKTPAEAWVDTVQKKAILAPPQLYNTLQFCRFTGWSDFKRFQEIREQEGCDLTLSIRLKCSDGELALLPGDDLYSDLYENISKRTNRQLGLANETLPVHEVPDSIEDLRAKAKNFNRYERRGRPRLISNSTLARGQAAPVTDPAELMMLAQVEQSKL